MPTMKEMCETIVEADILRLPGDIAPTAEQIWNSSPTGELYQVFEWYAVAKEVLAMKNTPNDQGNATALGTTETQR